MQLSPRQEFKGLFQWMNRATGEIDLPGAVVEKVGPSAGEAGREVTRTLCRASLKKMIDGNQKYRRETEYLMRLRLWEYFGETNFPHRWSCWTL